MESDKLRLLAGFKILLIIVGAISCLFFLLHDETICFVANIPIKNINEYGPNYYEAHEKIGHYKFPFYLLQLGAFAALMIYMRLLKRHFQTVSVKVFYIVSILIFTGWLFIGLIGIWFSSMGHMVG